MRGIIGLNWNEMLGYQELKRDMIRWLLQQIDFLRCFILFFVERQLMHTLWLSYFLRRLFVYLVFLYSLLWIKISSFLQYFDLLFGRELGLNQNMKYCLSTNQWTNEGDKSFLGKFELMYLWDEERPIIFCLNTSWIFLQQFDE